MVMPCSRSASSPSSRSAKSRSPPWVPTLRESTSERREVVLEHELRLVEQAADQRRLAVVDAAAGDEAQERLVLVRVEVRIDVGLEQVVDRVRHQKYPSCFFFSIDPLWSWSMTRPCRSDVVVSSVSWMTSVSVDAVLSTAPVSG